MDIPHTHKTESIMYEIDLAIRNIRRGEEFPELENIGLFWLDSWKKVSDINIKFISNLLTVFVVIYVYKRGKWLIKIPRDQSTAQAAEPRILKCNLYNGSKHNYSWKYELKVRLIIK